MSYDLFEFVCKMGIEAFNLIKSFVGVQGAVFQKSPLAAGGKDLQFIGISVKI